jgi:hypothetical protein
VTLSRQLYLAILSEFEHEAVLADRFHQFKRVEELRVALEVAQQTGHYDDVPMENQEIVESKLGDQNVECSDSGEDVDVGWYTPSNVYKYSTLIFTPVGVGTNSQDVVVETTVNLLPGSTVPAVSQTLDKPLEFLKIHSESTFPSKGDLSSPNVEMLEVTSSMKMLSANTVNAGAISVTTVNKHKDGNPPKKAAPRKPWAKKAVESKIGKQL